MTFAAHTNSTTYRVKTKLIQSNVYGVNSYGLALEAVGDPHGWTASKMLVLPVDKSLFDSARPDQIVRVSISTEVD